MGATSVVEIPPRVPSAASMSRDHVLIDYCIPSDKSTITSRTSTLANDLALLLGIAGDSPKFRLDDRV